MVLQTVVLREVNARLLAPKASSSRRCSSGSSIFRTRCSRQSPALPHSSGAGFTTGIRTRTLALSHGLGTLALRYAFDEAIIGRLRIGAAYLRQ